MEFLVTLFRLGLVFVLTVIFGLDRQRSHKPVGFGTFTFVAVGSCGLGIAAMDLVPANPLGLLAAVVTGIGFLGAGALIKSGDKIFGFTTSASMWVLAIFGLLIGVGQYLEGIAIYIMVWAVVLFDKYLETHGIGSHQKKLTIHTSKIVPQKEIETILILSTKKHKLIVTEVDKKNSRLSFTYLIEGKRDDINNGLKKFYDKDWFESFKVE
ncbi:MAG TPA: MgtC/SapB family protein [Candidatus Nanoarchaeia archaeon]|nr:MgtC/SapB family protein [Candidatus Nanoarchaeia archaeon]